MTDYDDVKTNHEILDMVERSVHEHEVFISFNTDDMAYVFHDWWRKEGLDLFAKFHNDLRRTQ